MDPTKQISLTLTWQTVQIISAALQELPFRVSSPILADLQAQIDAQVADNVVPIKEPASKDDAA